MVTESYDIVTESRDIITEACDMVTESCNMMIGLIPINIFVDMLHYPKLNSNDHVCTTVLGTTLMRVGGLPSLPTGLKTPRRSWVQ